MTVVIARRQWVIFEFVGRDDCPMFGAYSGDIEFCSSSFDGLVKLIMGAA